MTITYNAEVASIRSFGVFWKLLFRWKGSIYKLVWPDLTLYIILYFTLNMSYRFAMNDHHRKLFEEVSQYCGNFSTFIPMSFVLGFYVTIVVQRWWEQYLAMPWPDSLAVYVSTNIHGNDDRGRLIRRTIMRYVNLSFVYTMSQVCTRVKKRFPTLDHLVEAGIMNETEKKIFELMNKKTPHLKYWMPLVWAGSIVTSARKEGRIRDDFAVKTLVDSINGFRSGLGNVLNYDWISVPLVYTQTVTLAVYTFFMAELMGRQFVEGGKDTVDLYVPIFTFLQFFFYMGWLRVAETLFNPFGDDDDDFEINWMIDRNLQVSYIIVDEMQEDHPELVRDQYWEDVIPGELPYTVAAEQYRRDPPQGSAAQVEIKKTDMALVASVPEEEPRPSNEALYSAKDVEAGAEARESSAGLPVSSAVDVQPGPSLERQELLPRLAGVGSNSASVDSRMSGPLQTGSIKRSMMGLVNKFSNKIRDQPSGVFGTRPSSITRAFSRTSSESKQTIPQSPEPGKNTEPDEMFMMSDLDLAGGGGGGGGQPVSPAPDGPDSVAQLPPVVSGGVDLTARPATPSDGSEASLRQRRASETSEAGSAAGSEERPPPKFLPGDYNFMITTVPEEEEEDEPRRKPKEDSAERRDAVPILILHPDPHSSDNGSDKVTVVLPASSPPPAEVEPPLPPVDLASVLSTTFQPAGPDSRGGGANAEAAAGQQTLLSQLLTTIIEAAGGTVQPKPPTAPTSPVVSSPPPSPPPSPTERPARHLHWAAPRHAADEDHLATIEETSGGAEDLEPATPLSRSVSAPEWAARPEPAPPGPRPGSAPSSSAGSPAAGSSPASGELGRATADAAEREDDRVGAREAEEAAGPAEACEAEETADRAEVSEAEEPGESSTAPLLPGRPAGERPDDGSDDDAPPLATYL